MRLSFRLEVEDPADALALKRLVAHGEDLIEQEDISVDVDRDGESEPHVHSGGVGSDREVDEPLELAERHDLVETAINLLGAGARRSTRSDRCSRDR